MAMIDVSVLIPTVGRVETLPMVLYSIANQLPDLPKEVVILDEADRAISEHWAVSHAIDLLSLHGIKVVILRNRVKAGIGAARLRLAEAASHTQILMVDDDVALRPNVLVELRASLERHRENAHWAVPSCLLINKALCLDGYIDSRVSRTDPRVTQWTDKHDWFVPYYLYDEHFEQQLKVAGTQCILFRNKGRLLHQAKRVGELGALPREDTYLTRVVGPGVFTSASVCDHFEHSSQPGRANWGNSMFYRLHDAATDRPDDFLNLLGRRPTQESNDGE